MKSFYRLSTALLFLLTLGIFNAPKVLAQCPAPNNNFPNFNQFDLTPTGIGDTVRNSSSWGGDYHHVQVDSGKTYVISTCETQLYADTGYSIGAPGIYFPEAITLYEDTAPAGNFGMHIKRTVGFASNNCPTVIPSPNNDPNGSGSTKMAIITYTADFTGNLAVSLDPYDTTVINSAFPPFQCDSFVVDSTIIFVTQIILGIEVNISEDNPISCPGLSDGALTATVTGNDGSFTYLWSNAATTASITGLSAGTYSVIVVDSLMGTDTAFYTLNDPASIALSFIASQETSFGAADGKLKTIPTNGTPPYTYAWNTGATADSISGLSAANYTVTVTDANGCTISETKAVTLQPAWQFEGGDFGSLILNGAAATQQGSNPAGLDTAVITGRYGGTTIVDLDGDGDMDFVSGSITGQFFFFENTGTPTAPHWQRSTKIPTLDSIDIARSSASNEVRAEFADMDADGDLDLLAGTRLSRIDIPNFKLDDIAYYQNIGSATNPIFTADTLPGTMFQQLAEFPNIAANDIDADGDLDLLVIGSDSGSYLENIGTPMLPSFERRLKSDNILDGWNDISSLVAHPDLNDFDGDGDLDIYYMNEAGFARVVYNIGSATTPDFGSFANFPVPSLDTVDFGSFGALDFADVNGDGLKDVIANSFNPVRWVWFSQIAYGLNTSFSLSNVKCNGGTDGTAKVSVSGATNPITYLWSNGATTDSIGGLAAGTYIVTVTDGNSDTAIDSVMITEPAALVAATVVDANTSCNGASDGGATASATGGTMPYTYTWSDTSFHAASITGVPAGTYSVTITDQNGCTDSTSVTITEPASVVATITLDSNVTCPGFTGGGATASATGGTMPYRYLWSNSDTIASITGVVDGTYFVTITDNSGCTDSASVTITATNSSDVPPLYQVGNSFLSNSYNSNGEFSSAAALRFNNDGTRLFVSGVTQDSILEYSLSTAYDITTMLRTGAAFGTGTFSNFNYGLTFNDDGMKMYLVSGGGTDRINEFNLLAPFDITSAVHTGFADALAFNTFDSQPREMIFNPDGTKMYVAGANTDSIFEFDLSPAYDVSTAVLAGPSLSLVGIQSTVGGLDFSEDGSQLFISGFAPSGIHTFDLATPWDVSTGGQNVAQTYSITGATSFTSGIEFLPNGLVFITSGLSTEILQEFSMITGTPITACDSFAIGNVTYTNSGLYPDTLTNVGGCDSIAYRDLTINLTTTASFNVTECTSYTVPSGDSTYTISGTYMDTILNAKGCDSIMTIAVTITGNPVAAAVVDSNVTCNSFSNGGATASATGGTQPYTYAWSNSATTAGITGVAAGTYNVTITDANGCNDTSSVTITEPAALIAATVLDSNDIGNGGGATASVTGGTIPYNYAWSNAATTASITGVSAASYTVTITDANSCTDTETITITAGPVITINVDSNVSCNGLSDGGITASLVGGVLPYMYAWSTSTSSATIATTASITGVTAGQYKLTVTDANGLTDVDSVMITEPTLLASAIVIDSNVTCKSGTNGGATASATGGTQPYSYAWSNSATTATITGVTAGSYTVTITDMNGCTATSNASITEPDLIVFNLIQIIDASCNGGSDGGFVYVITGGTPKISGSDTTYLVSIAGEVDKRDSVSGLGAGLVEFLVGDENGCVSDTVRFTIGEPTVLSASTTVDSTVSCNAGADGGATASATGGTAPYTYAWSNSATTAGITGVVAGTYTVTVTDANGCTNTETATITEPTLLVVSTVLDSNASCAGQLDGGTTGSAVGGTAPYTYAWSNTATTASITGVTNGNYTVTVTDGNGCTDTSSIAVGVLDLTKPTVVAQNSTAYLDANGLVTVLPASVNNGSTDACGIATVVLDSTNFDCSEIGANAIVLTVTDVSGNSDTASAIITVVDTVPPTVITQNVTVYLDAAGAASITTTDINNGSSDNCAIQGITLDITNFTCIEVGTNTVELRITDVNGNVDSASAVVTVVDTIKPTVITQNVTVYLDAAGVASITTTDVDNGTTDICGTPALSLDITSFTCTEVGANTVQLRATDVNGNIDSSSAVVTVVDTIKPTVLTQDITVYLDASGQATITETMIDNGTNDNCGLQVGLLDSTNFDCTEVGANTVYLRVVDVNNNIDSASAVVTVLDTINPLISGCPVNINQTIDAGGCTAVVTWTAPTAADNCNVDSLVASHNPGDVFALGITTVTYIAYDPELNTDTCRFTVTVTDSEDPVIANMPSNITINNDLGNCGAVATWTSATASDNCQLDSLRSDFQSGASFPVGTTTVTYTAYDASMNTTTASFTVTVVDNELPIVTCPANMAQCDSIVNFTAATATDNCGVTSIVRLDNTGLNSGDEFPIGITTISYLITDVNNNQDSCSFDIEVYAPPVANAGKDLVTRDIEPVLIEASSTNGVSFRWTPAFSVAIDTAEQPIVNPQETTTYTMEVTTADGCSITDEMTVTVDVVTKLDATTLFSPNGDGMNDTWVVNKPALIQGCKLIIVNRNGSEVYSTTNYNNEWDGTVNGKQLPEGTYYYIFDCPDGKTLNGPITILRERR